MSKINSIFADGIEILCNGSTTDFGSVCPGSNPGISTQTISRSQDRLFYNTSPVKACFLTGEVL